MAWWQRVTSVFGRRRADPAQQVRYIPVVPETGIRLTEDEALQLSAVWACIDAIAKAIASCRWNIYLPSSGGRRELLESDSLAWVLNTRPNPEMTAIAFREAMLYIAIPFGNSYAEITRDMAGRVSELWPLEYNRVRPRRDEKGTLFYEYTQPDGEPVRLEQRQVFHLRGPSLTGFLGENLVARAARSLSAAAAAERSAAAFFGRGLQPTGAFKSPKTLSTQAHNNLKADILAKQKNKHDPLILEDGLDYVPFTMEPVKSQLVESRQFSVEEICRWFGVPPHKVQHLLRSTFSNIEHQSIEFVRDALRPWERRLCQEADFKLFPQNRGPWRETEIDLAPLSYGDALSRAQAHAVWRQNGIMSANEIRMREGLNDAGNDGDVLLVQSNLTTVENILNPPTPPAPALPPGEPVEEEDDDEAEDLDPSVEAKAIARKSLAMFAAAALDRGARRLLNRQADLAKRHPADAVQQLLNEERQKLLTGLVDELGWTGDLAVTAVGRRLVEADALRAYQALEGGAAPAVAAEAMLTAATLA